MLGESTGLKTNNIRKRVACGSSLEIDEVIWIIEYLGLDFDIWILLIERGDHLIRCFDDRTPRTESDRFFGCGEGCTTGDECQA
ncbi:MAG: hypothetical protein JO151_15485 [Verrucomicrobia bacterium]|nr:hypothetical protein [Verrucomicrobiota bacterium]